jgi:hypothetical protein
MNTNNKYCLKVNLENTSKDDYAFNEVIVKFIKVKVFNTNNELLYSEYGGFDGEIDAGIYYIRAEFNGLFEDVPLFLLDKDKVIYIQSPKFYSSLPIQGFESTHEYYSNIVFETCAKNSAQTALVFFLRFPTYEIYQMHKNGETGKKNSLKDPFQGFSIVDEQGKTLNIISAKQARLDDEFGWMIFDKILKPGWYFLAYKYQKDYRYIPFSINENWQTHVFITLNPEPIFETLRITLKKSGYFSDTAQYEDVYNEIILQNIQNNDFELPPSVLEYTGYAKWENPVFGILAIYSYLKNNKHSHDSFIKHVLHNLDESIIPGDSPSVVILKILLQKHFNHEWIGQYKIENPPIFNFLYEELIHLSAEDPMLIPVNSFNDLISTSIFQDSVFTSFRYAKQSAETGTQESTDDLKSRIFDIFFKNQAFTSEIVNLEFAQKYASEIIETKPSLKDNLLYQSQAILGGLNQSFQKGFPTERDSLKEITKAYNIPSATAARAVNLNQQSEISSFINSHREDLESADLNESTIQNIIEKLNTENTNKPPQTMPIQKNQYINVGPSGTFRPSDASEFDTTPEDIDQMFEHFEQEGTKKIVIYFHGGLVGLNAGMETAEKITRWIDKTTDAKPVTFVWETGPFRTIWDNINEISKTKLFDGLKKKLLKKVGEKLGIDLESKGPVKNLSDAEIEAELQKEAPFEDFFANDGARSTTITPESAEDLDAEDTGSNEFRALEDEFTDEFAQEQDLYKAYIEETINKDFEFLDKEKLVDASADDENKKGIPNPVKLAIGAAKIAIRVIKRMLNKRDHGFYPTVVEEILREFYIANIGSWIWSGMQRKAEKMWESNDGLTGLNQHAGRYFFEKLYAYYHAHQGIEVTAIGHSAGSIATSHLLDLNSRTDNPIRFKNFIFFAPACRCDLFAEKVLPNESLIDNFRMFTMADEYETKDHMISFFYPRSLLYFISGILEGGGNSPDEYILGLQRHIDARKPYDTIEILNKINAYLAAGGKNRQVFSVTKDVIDGMQSSAIKHGSFDDDSLDAPSGVYAGTLASLSFMIGKAS